MWTSLPTSKGCTTATPKLEGPSGFPPTAKQFTQQMKYTDTRCRGHLEDPHMTGWGSNNLRSCYSHRGPTTLPGQALAEEHQAVKSGQQISPKSLPKPTCSEVHEKSEQNQMSNRLAHSLEKWLLLRKSMYTEIVFWYMNKHLKTQRGFDKRSLT